MCAVYDEISIWDWAAGKKSYFFSNDNVPVLHVYIYN